jgi:hypothetical protein
MLTLAVEVEDRRGRRATGYTADFLAFRWFDKHPDRSLADNCADLLRTVEVARARYLEAATEGFDTPFGLWRDPSRDRAEGARRRIQSPWRIVRLVDARAQSSTRSGTWQVGPCPSWCGATSAATGVTLTSS